SVQPPVQDPVARVSVLALLPVSASVVRPVNALLPEHPLLAWQVVAVWRVSALAATAQSPAPHPLVAEFRPLVAVVLQLFAVHLAVALTEPLPDLAPHPDPPSATQSSRTTLSVLLVAAVLHEVKAPLRERKSTRLN